MITPRRIKPALLALLTLTGLATASTYSYYQYAMGDWESIGYDAAYNGSSGNLRQGQTTSWTYRAYGGDRYLNFAVCDDDCDDIDLYLYDQSGRLVAQDTESDDTPYVAYSVPFTQTLKVVVKMEDCSYNPCEYRLGYMSK